MQAWFDNWDSILSCLHARLWVYYLLIALDEWGCPDFGQTGGELGGHPHTSWPATLCVQEFRAHTESVINWQ